MTDRCSTLVSLQTEDMLSKKETEKQRGVETDILPHNNVPNIPLGMILRCEFEWDILFFFSLVLCDLAHGDKSGIFSLQIVHQGQTKEFIYSSYIQLGEPNSLLYHWQEVSEVLLVGAKVAQGSFCHSNPSLQLHGCMKLHPWNSLSNLQPTHQIVSTPPRII